MKKTLGILSAVGVIAISATSVIGCIAPKYASGVAGQRVVLATESGKINDHAFNEDAYKGLNIYLKNEYNLLGQNNYVEAADASYTSLVSGYRLAKLKKADALVLSGFAHVPTLSEATKLFKNQTVILIDGKPDDYSNPEFKNVISIVFNSQIASMQAVFDAAYWATTLDAQGKMQGDVNGDGKITFGTFGGTSFKYAVDNYMWGAFLGVELFNQYYATIPQESYRKVYLANTANHQVSGLKITSSSDAAYYTGNFQLGGATKSGIVDRLIDAQKSDLIFPIAGPQIQDVLSYRPRSSAFTRLPYIIGVDGDQASAYDRDTVRGRFITSAIKNISSATQAALKHSSSLKDEVIDSEGHQELVSRTDPSKLWDGSSPTPFLNWSVDLLDDGSGKYQLKDHQLYLYDESDAEKIPSESNELINFVNTEFEKTSMEISSYMDGALIHQIAADIVKKVQSGEIKKLVNYE